MIRYDGSGWLKCGTDFDRVRDFLELFGIKPQRQKGGVWLNRTKKIFICWLDPLRGNVKNDAYPWDNSAEYGESIDPNHPNAVVIYEKHLDPDENKGHIESALAQERYRYIFWKEHNRGYRWYKFYGKYELDCERTQKENRCVWVKVADNVNVNER